MSVVRLALVSTMSIQSIATASTVTLSAIAPLVAAAIGMPSSFIGTMSVSSISAPHLPLSQAVLW